MQFSEWVRQMRLERKMDIRTFAQHVGIDNGNLSRIENERVEITLITVTRICMRLGISPPLLLEMLYNQPMPHLELHASLGQKVMPTLSDIHAFLQYILGNRLLVYRLLTDLLNSIESLYTTVEVGLRRSRRHLFVPEDIEKLLARSPLYHFELRYPPNLKPHQLWDIYRCGAFLNETDIGIYVKRTRQEKQLSQVRLQNVGKISDSALSRYEGGTLERVKLIDIMTLDEQLEQEGKVVVLCLQVCHFNELLTRLLSQNTKRNDETELFPHNAGEMHLIDLFTTICRWLLQDHPHEEGWIDELREKLALDASDEETIGATGEVYKG